MPILSEFSGIKIYIYWDDHLPPHIHAEYSNFRALIDIDKCVVIKGILPINKTNLVLSWCKLHKAELFDAWKKVCNHQMPLKITPLNQ